MMKSVLRHSLAVRLAHWSIALSGVVLLFSGFGQMPMYKRYNVVKIPGLSWSSDYEITLLLHYIGAAIFCGAVFFHLFYHLRRKEFAALPRKGDLAEGVQGFMAMFKLAEEPVHEKFQAKQRLIYGMFGLVTLLLIITGLIKSYKNLGAIIVDPMILQLVAFAHTILGMVFMVMLLAHVAALLLKNHRPLIPSMITGRVNREYARKHHPRWQPKEERVNKHS